MGGAELSAAHRAIRGDGEMSDDNALRGWFTEAELRSTAAGAH